MSRYKITYSKHAFLSVFIWCDDKYFIAAVTRALLALESILSTQILKVYCIIAREMKRLFQICYISSFPPHNIN